MKRSSLKNKFVHVDRLPSTNSHSWDLIHNGNESGVVLTSDQFNGKGQRNNNWISSIHGSITFSLFAQKELPSNVLSMLPILAGLSVQQGLLDFNINALLKWPNDIMLNNKKIGGVLCESNIRGSFSKFIVIGVGLNVNDDQKSLIENNLKNATSLKAECGKEYVREKIICSVIDRLELNLSQFPKNSKSIINGWESVCSHLNMEIDFKNNLETLSGKFLGLNNDGRAKILLHKKKKKLANIQVI